MTPNIASDEWIAFHAHRQPHKVALQDEQTTLTYAQLNDLIARLASQLAAKGIRAGDAVGLLGSPILEWAVAFLAITRAGATPVGLNYRETPRCICDQAQTARASLVLHDKGRLDHAHATGLPLMPLEDVLELPQAAPGVDAPGVDAPGMATRPDNSSQIGVILFTGGTTGASKAVVLTHENLLWNIFNEIAAGNLSRNDNTLVATALHHSAALNTWLLPHLYLGATATFMGDFEPRRWIELMQKFKATNTFTPPTMIRQILDAGRPGDDWSSFTKWFSGAGLLSAGDRKEMLALREGLEIYYQYGLTEAGPIVTCQSQEEFKLSPASMGRPVRHVRVKVLAEDGSEVPVGGVGELFVQGPNVMPGYLGQPEATALVLKDGWLKTGDLVALDAHGCLTFHDRGKDMIKSGGLNIFSQEIETAIATHPEVSEVSVVGVTDSKWGERVVAVVSLKSNAGASTEAILEHCRGRLASYQVPKEVIFMPVSEVPKNYLGKTLKRELRAKLNTATDGSLRA